MQTLLYIYLAGLAATILYECYKFSQQVKLLTSFSSFVFILLEALKQCAKAILYPVTGLIFVLQLPFVKSVVDETNKVLAEYNGYPLEDKEYEDGKD